MEDALSNCEKYKMRLKESVSAYTELIDRKNGMCMFYSNSRRTYVDCGSTDSYKANIKSICNDILMLDAIIKVSCTENK